MIAPFIVTATRLTLLFLPHITAYTLVDSYDGSNFFDSFKFHDEADPTNGFVDYVSKADALSSGIARTIGSQVYLGVDNSTVIPSTNGAGRKSNWLTSNKPFLHGLLIGDFAHMPGSVCGLWPAFWTIREDDAPYGEIDIIEGYNNIDTNFATMHTQGEAGVCTFNTPEDQQTGTSNQGSTDCASGIGCSVQGKPGTYGTGFNENGGGVYAMEWTSDAINIFHFARSAIPADITEGNPNPANWGLPQAKFDSKSGDCNIDANFPRQTIYINTDFCGPNAGGQAWTDWTTCSADTQVSTCEAFVAGNPDAFDDAYWLINSIKVYQ